MWHGMPRARCWRSPRTPCTPFLCLSPPAAVWSCGWRATPGPASGAAPWTSGVPPSPPPALLQMRSQPKNRRPCHRLPVLPPMPASPCSLGWAPWDDRLLVYAEQAKHVHLRRVPSGAEAADGCVEQHAVDGAATCAAVPRYGLLAGGAHSLGPQAPLHRRPRPLLSVALSPPSPACLLPDLGDATAGYQLLRLPIMGAHGGLLCGIWRHHSRAACSGVLLHACSLSHVSTPCVTPGGRFCRWGGGARRESEAAHQWHGYDAAGGPAGGHSPGAPACLALRLCGTAPPACAVRCTGPHYACIFGSPVLTVWHACRPSCCASWAPMDGPTSNTPCGRRPSGRRRARCCCAHTGRRRAAAGRRACGPCRCLCCSMLWLWQPGSAPTGCPSPSLRPHPAGVARQRRWQTVAQQQMAAKRLLRWQAGRAAECLLALLMCCRHSAMLYMCCCCMKLGGGLEAHATAHSGTPARLKLLPPLLVVPSGRATFCRAVASVALPLLLLCILRMPRAAAGGQRGCRSHSIQRQHLFIGEVKREEVQVALHVIHLRGTRDDRLAGRSMCVWQGAGGMRPGAAGCGGPAPDRRAAHATAAAAAAAHLPVLQRPAQRHLRRRAPQPLCSGH